MPQSKIRNLKSERKMIMTQSIAPQAAERFEPDCMPDRAMPENGEDSPWLATFFVQGDHIVPLDSRTVVTATNGEREAAAWTLAQTMSVYNP